MPAPILAGLRCRNFAVFSYALLCIVGHIEQQAPLSKAIYNNKLLISDLTTNQMIFWAPQPTPASAPVVSRTPTGENSTWIVKMPKNCRIQYLWHFRDVRFGSVAAPQKSST